MSRYCSDCGKAEPRPGSTLCTRCTPHEVLDAGSKPTLANDPAEWYALLAGGRRTELLKEGKHFDTTRLNESPLFAPTIPTLFSEVE